MKQCRITVMRVARYDDLIAQYENPIQHACDMALSHGAEDFYDGWMKNKRSAMLSCNDGFRPVTFLVEALEEEV